MEPLRLVVATSPPEEAAMARRGRPISRTGFLTGSIISSQTKDRQGRKKSLGSGVKKVTPSKPARKNIAKPKKRY